MIKPKLTRTHNQLHHYVRGIKYLISQLSTSAFNNPNSLLLFQSCLSGWRATGLCGVHSRPAPGRYLHSAVEETLYAIRKMQCNKLHQGFTSHDARLHFSLTNEYLSFSEMIKHSKPLWAKFFPLLRSVF